MSVSSGSYYSTLILVAIVSFFFGALFYRIMTRYPFGQKPITGKESLVGRKGIVSSMEGRKMTVRVDSLYWRAKLESECAIHLGDPVIVTSLDNLMLVVRPE